MPEIEPNVDGPELKAELAKVIEEFEIRFREAGLNVVKARRALALKHQVLADVLLGRAKDLELQIAAGRDVFNYDQTQRSVWVELEWRAGGDVQYHRDVYETALDELAMNMPAHAANLRQLPMHMLELAIRVGAIKVAGSDAAAEEGAEEPSLTPEAVLQELLNKRAGQP
jgi:hypothetical protein